MARHKGKDGAIQVGGVDIGEVEGFDLEVTINEIDANVIGQDWTDVCGGQKSASGTINVLRDPNDAGQAALAVGATPQLTLYPEGDTSGLTEISGTFLVTSRSKSVNVGDLVKNTYNIRNKGEVTEGTIA